MINLIIKYLIIAAAIMFGARYINGIRIDSFETSIYVALAMGFANTFIKPILIANLTFFETPKTA